MTFEERVKLLAFLTTGRRAPRHQGRRMLVTNYQFDDTLIHALRKEDSETVKEFKKHFKMSKKAGRIEFKPTDVPGFDLKSITSSSIKWGKVEIELKDGEEIYTFKSNTDT